MPGISADREAVTIGMTDQHEDTNRRPLLVDFLRVPSNGPRLSKGF